VHPARGSSPERVASSCSVAEHYDVAAGCTARPPCPRHNHASERIDDLDLHVRVDAATDGNAALERVVGGALGRTADVSVMPYAIVIRGCASRSDLLITRPAGKTA